MSFGAAFYAANKTNLFRVRPVHFYDGNNFETLMVLKNSLPEAEAYLKEVNLFS